MKGTFFQGILHFLDLFASNMGILYLRLEMIEFICG